MNTSPQHGPHASRLNPFAFPSETTSRFVLLIISVVGASLFVYDFIYFSFNGQVFLGTLQNCSATAETTFSIGTSEYWIAFNQCMAPIRQVQATWWFSGIALLVTVAGVIYWILPAWKIWRDRLTPLCADDSPEVVSYLISLSREAGLSRPPQFMINPLNGAINGLAFGRLGRYYVALTGGLVTKFYTDLPAFRAVVLHELAHLRNADVDKTYFSVAIWRAFLIATCIPFVVSIFFSANSLAIFVNFGWRTLALAILVYLTRNAVLRTREVYADVRASVWDRHSGGLRRLLEALPRSEKSHWRYMMSVHPDPLERQRALDDTRYLFRVGFWETLATGVAATITVSSTFTVVSLLTTGMDRILWGLTPAQFASLGATLVVMPLAVGVVGTGAWRATFAALTRGEPFSGAAKLALGLALGFFLGLTLSFQEGIQTDVTPQLTDLMVRFGLNALLTVLMLFGLFFIFECVVGGASTWLEVVVTERSAQLAYTISTATASIALSVWFAAVFLIRQLSLPLLDEVGLDVILAVVSLILGIIWLTWQDPFTILALVSVWGFPLAAWLWRRQVALNAESNWAFLDVPSQRLMPARQPPFRLNLALMVGLGSGMVFCAFLLVFRIGLHLAIPENLRRTVFAVGLFTMVPLVQVIAAAVVAGWVTRLGALHGLFAAFVTGCVVTGGVLAAQQLAVCVDIFSIGPGDGCAWIIDLATVWTIFSQAIGMGSLLALPVALAASSLAQWIRRSALPLVQQELLSL